MSDKPTQKKSAHTSSATSPRARGNPKGLYIVLISPHGLIRGQHLELGRDSDTGGQTKYVVELARALAAHPDVERVDLLTRRIHDPKVSDDYAQPEEKLARNAHIIRIPTGPRRYLRKEVLWPYLDCFADNALKYIRSVGRLPDVIHSHYADAGYVATHLANLLGVALVHTGHSLGRCKRERLLANGMSEETIEKRYNMASRIAAEEAVLASANMVVTSTRQEVEEQYALYDHYRPERMEVLPPGTDLERFHPPRRGEQYGPVKGKIDRFLADPNKPMVLAISRPDERKNIPTLIKAYGTNAALRETANLVIVAGTRDDIRAMDKGPREVLREILYLIDLYDLYGQVAYPKDVQIEEIPQVYRLATRAKGVFINPALTEPFGLTLIEAAASGVPIVATQDGGPRDIVEYCRNGVLIDPFDPERMGEVLLDTLTDKVRWRRYSESGIKGAKQHFSWEGHAAKYVKKIKGIVGPRRQQKSPPNLWRRLPFTDRVLISDIDETLIGDRKAVKALMGVLREHRDKVGFGIATARRLETALEALKEWGIPVPDVMITALGTEIYYGPNLSPDVSWSNHIDHRWDRERIRKRLGRMKGIKPQNEADQRPYKLSFYVDRGKAPSAEEIEHILWQEGLHANLVYSQQRYLDVVPERASQGMAIRYFADKWGIPIEQVAVAGDSGDDIDMIRGRMLGIVVGNHDPEMEVLRSRKRVYFARAEHARGVLEGLEHYDFFGRCRLPG